MSTSNIGLGTSTAGVDTEATAASREQANLLLLDAHDHTSGKGVKVPTGGLNINADLPMGSNSLTGLKSTQFVSQVSSLVTTNTLYVKNGELYYIDNAGNSVQITSGGSVSVATLLSGNVFLDGGNTRGANLRLGSNDNYSFFFETNNTDRFQINGSGFMSFISDWGFQPSTNSSTGSINNVSTSTTSYLQMTGVGSTTITGLANGSSGKTLLISNQTGSGLTLKNESISSTAANRIQTGTGNDISIADKASAILIYNSTTSRWSLLTGAATAATLTNPIGNVAANDSNVTFTNADNRSQTCTPTASRNYTMPTTSISAGDTWEFFNTSATAAALIKASGGATIDYLLPKGYIQLRALVNTPTTAADWQVIRAHSQWSSLGISSSSFSAGFGTVTNIEVYYRRVGDTLHIRGRAKAGTVAASQGCFILPTIAGTQLNINTSFVGTSLTSSLGGSQRISSGGGVSMNTAGYSLSWAYNSGQGTDRIQLVTNVGSAAYSDNNANSILANTDGFDFWNAQVPISGWN